MADDIAALIRHLALSQVDLMGYSMGGGVALRVGIQHSGLVHRRVLVYGDADSISPAHIVEFFGLLGGGKGDAGWDRAKMPVSRLAILPATTHYDSFASPLVIDGERSPAVLRQAAQSLADALPMGHYRTLLGQGHDLVPEAIGPVVQECFLAQTTEPIV